MDTINNILSVIGLVSLVITVVRIIRMIFSPKDEWMDNIEIKEIDGDNQELDFDNMMMDVFRDEDNEYSSVNLIIPQGCIIRNLKVKRIVDKSIAQGKEIYKTVKIIPLIYPDMPFCMVVPRQEAIAKYMIEWKMEYGKKAQYYFYDNLRDGDNQKHGIKYTSGIVCKVRQLLGFN